MQDDALDNYELEEEMEIDIELQQQAPYVPRYDPLDPNLYISQFGRKHLLPRAAVTELLKWARKPATQARMGELESSDVRGKCRNCSFRR